MLYAEQTATKGEAIWNIYCFIPSCHAAYLTPLQKVRWREGKGYKKIVCFEVSAVGLQLGLVAVRGAEAVLTHGEAELRRPASQGHKGVSVPSAQLSHKTTARERGEEDEFCAKSNRSPLPFSLLSSAKRNKYICHSRHNSLLVGQGQTSPTPILHILADPRIPIQSPTNKVGAFPGSPPPPPPRASL